MSLLDSTEYEINLVKNEKNIPVFNAISGYFFHVYLYNTIHVEPLKAIILIKDNSCHSTNVTASLWLDAKASDIVRSKTAKIDIVQEFELLHLLSDDKSHVHQYLPITCEVEFIDTCSDEKLNLKCNNKIKDEFLL